MSQDVVQEPAASPLRFDRAEFAEASAATRCALCGDPLAGSYFEINGHMACPPCRAKIGTTIGRGSRAVRFLRALAGGLGGAVLGAGIYYAVLAITNYEIGLIAIVVGFLVGGAVRWGCYGRGGWLYQGLAMALTYVAIVSTYVPFLFKAANEQQASAPAATADTTATAAGAPAPATASSASAAPARPAVPRHRIKTFGEFAVAIVTMIGIVLALPFLAGFQNFMGWLIIGFAVYQAWKMNRRRQLVVTGPFRLAGAAAADLPAAALEPA